MKKREAFFKKILVLGVSIGLTLGSMGILSGCGQKEQQNTPTNPPPVVEVVPGTGEGDTGTEQTPGTEVQETKLEVTNIVNEHFGDIDFANEFNLALIDLVSKKVDIEKVEDIDVVSFEAKTDGKLVLNVTYVDGEEKESDTLTYEGDTTKFENFYKLSTNSAGIINGIVTENGLTLDGQVVENSSAHTNLEGDFEALVATYNAEKATFGNISANEIVVYEEPKPIEYVTVQSIVDDVFGDMDFDGDTKEVMETIITTKTPIFEVKNNVAINYEIGQDGKINVVAECLNTRTTLTSLYCYAYSGDTNQYANFLKLAGNFEGTLTTLLAQKGLTIDSSVDKFATTTASLKAELEQLKTNYEEEKASFASIDKSVVLGRTLITPKYFSSQELTSLGIQDTKAFAQAVLENEKWQSQGVDTGWTMDDVVAVYVTDFGAEDIDKSSKATMVVVTDDGVYSHELYTRRLVGDATTDRHGMILSDNPNTWLDNTTKLIDFAGGKVVFDENGERVEETLEPQTMALYAENKIIGFYGKDGKTRLL